MPRYRLKACPTCGSDMYLDEEDGDWVCLGGHRFPFEGQINAPKRVGYALKPLDQYNKPLFLLLARLYTPETVELFPVPPRPFPRNNVGAREYFEGYRVRIIAEAFAYGERAVRARWGISPGMWMGMKHRWHLPIAPKGGEGRYHPAMPGQV